MTLSSSNHSDLTSRSTSIPGLIEFDLPVISDNRGWFKENFQQAKMVALGLPEGFNIVQNNISFNSRRGVTRGIHAEPWDKFISVANGSVFAAIVDLRAGDNFGKVETFQLDTGKALFVPNGCGNSFQALEDNTVYTYLVNSHWSPELDYPMVNLGDPQLAIGWPIPLDQAEISEKDRAHPPLSQVTPVVQQYIYMAVDVGSPKSSYLDAAQGGGEDGRH